MNKENRVILIDTKNKTAFDLTFIDDKFTSSFGGRNLIDNINLTNYDLALNLLQVISLCEDNVIQRFAANVSYDVNLYGEFNEVKADDKLYEEFATSLK